MPRRLLIPSLLVAHLLHSVLGCCAHHAHAETRTDHYHGTAGHGAHEACPGPHQDPQLDHDHELVAAKCVSAVPADPMDTCDEAACVYSLDWQPQGGPAKWAERIHPLPGVPPAAPRLTSRAAANGHAASRAWPPPAVRRHLLLRVLLA